MVYPRPVSINFQREIAGRTPEQGYSLLEIIIGLAIMALVATLSVTNGIRLVSSAEERSALQNITGQIESGRIRALIERKALVLAAGNVETSSWLAAPEGWSVVADPELVFSPAGICSGGRVRITSPRSAVYTFTATKPNCKLIATSDLK